jgi:hypothetical protein
MLAYLPRCWRRLTSSKTIKYLGLAILVLGLALAFLPYTGNRGWGWPEVITWVVSTLSLGHTHLEPNILYAVEAKVLAHTADLLFGLFVVFIGMIIYHIFWGKDPSDIDERYRNDAGKINREIRTHLEKIRRK